MGVREYESINSGEVALEIGVLVIVLIGLGMCFIIYSWIRHRPALCGSIPVAATVFPMIEILHAHGVNPGGAGHLAGALVGTLFLPFILQTEVATNKTAGLLGAVSRVWFASCGLAVVVRENWEQRTFPKVFCLLLGVTILGYILFQYG